MIDRNGKLCRYRVFRNLVYPFGGPWGKLVCKVRGHSHYIVACRWCGR